MFDYDVRQCGAKIVSYTFLIAGALFFCAAILDKDVPEKDFRFLIGCSIISIAIFLFRKCLLKK